ncbi:YD repeat-containing protein [Candidatus Gracilibacteria bacterium]|nr:YD repeat-containing protein [Candidatus Gracilibacteria bacterium]
MIGYKATYKGICLNQLYEVGEIYTLDGELVMCENGFHFCQDLYDVFNYYLPNKNIKVFKVEALGNIKTKGDKSVTDKIKILEEVDLSNMIVEKNGYKKYFDNNKNYVKEKLPDDSFYKYEYDKRGNLIKYEHSDGYCMKYEYDENDNVIKCENAYGNYVKNYYDGNNKCIKVERG